MTNATNKGLAHPAAAGGPAAREPYPRPVIDEKGRPRAATRILALGAVLIVTAGLFFFLRDRMNETFVLGLLGILSMIGVFYLFASVIGVVRVAGDGAGQDLPSAFLDTLAEGTVITDAKGRLLYANQAYATMTGARDAADIQSVETLLSRQEEAANAVYRLVNAAARNQPASEEFRLLRGLRPGLDSPTWYRARVRGLRVPDIGGPLYCWQLQDISAERGDQELFFQELQTAIDHLDRAPVGFFSSEPGGRIAYINATLAEWLGIDLADFATGQVGLNDIVAGDGLALLGAVKADPGKARTTTFDLDLIRAGGQRMPARFVCRLQTAPDGAPGPMRTIVLNPAEGGSPEDIRAAEFRFIRFFDSAPMAIAAVDANGRILRTNAPFLALFRSMVDRDSIDRRIRLDSVVHPRDRERLAHAVAEAADNKADIAPFDSVLPTDETRHVRYFVSAVAGRANTEAGAPEESAIVFAMDMTEQKALESQMAQSQKMQAVGQLAGGIAHDFNNVLTAIIMSSDLLLNTHRPADPSFQDIMNIKQNANRAASLVRQLLAFSRRQTLRPEVLSLTDVLADLRMLLARLVGNGVMLDIEHGRDLWPVKADLGQFEQVIVNLAVNARDAMPSGGKLTIRTRNVTAAECAAFGHRGLEAADYALVEVQDSGTGIPGDVIDKIFEPFFTTKEVGKGTGLGLSMVYGIVKQTGGFIYAVSEPGHGALFRIFLPRHVSQAGDPVTPVAVREPDKKRDLSGSATVLLVEDEDAVRMGGLRALQSRGYTVHEASSGVEALEIMRELDGKVDIVVSDVVMPEMDGPTLLRELRKDHPDIKFIFVSGYAEDAFSRNLPEGAVFGFLPKPFSLKQLATAVKEMLEKN